MYNRRYEKIFLMLRQETAGYAIGSRAPWGSCILELKNGGGRLQLSVQGLRPLRQPYAVYILAGEESIFCGRLSPDAKEGYATLKWDFAPDAIGNGKRVEDIHTVLLLAEYGENGISAPLLAYVAEEMDWRALFSRIAPQPEPPAQIAEPIALQAAEAPLRKEPAPPAEKPHIAIAQAQKSSFHGSFQGLLAKFRQELQELEAGGILSAEELERIRGKKEPQAEQDVPAETPVEPLCIAEYAEQAASAEKPEPEKIEEIEDTPEILVETPAADASRPDPFAHNLELQPFAEGESWKCISLGELTLLAQIPLRWQREFFFLLPQRRYHHLILREGEDGVWLGLPASYAESDAADAKKFGFDTFRRVDGDWGYWLARLEKDG